MVVVLVAVVLMGDLDEVNGVMDVGDVDGNALMRRLR